ncbi:MAG: ParB/RepB/Spo0J family partition protein, partial [Patescibacteria group bacterium]
GSRQHEEEVSTREHANPHIIVQQIPLHLIDPNPHQPREHFDHTALEDLVASIIEHGVLQPIVVTMKPDGRYELIAGERRLRATKVAGLETIPSLVRSATEQQKLELAIIENVQRTDLNPLEEARAYLRLQGEFNLTQDEIGTRVGKSRPQVANIIRLLSLPQEIQHALAEGRISQSNARTLLSLPTDTERMELFQQMLAGNFTVRQTEARVGSTRTRRVSGVDPNLVATETKLREHFGAKVTITRNHRGEGEIRISFLNEEDLNGIVGKICVATSSTISPEFF